MGALVSSHRRLYRPYDREQPEYCSNLPASGGGGGLTPLVGIDFKNGVYSISGVAKTLGDVLTADANFGPYNPADVIAGVGLELTGVANQFSLPVLTAAALIPVLPSAGGATVVIVYSVLNENCSVDLDVTTSPAFTPDWFLSMTSPDSAFCAISDNVAPQVQFGLAIAGANKAAYTYCPARLSASLNGGVVGTIAAPDANLSANAIALEVSIIPVTTSTVIVESVMFYPVQPDSALPGLST